MNFTNINDPAGVKALLDQLRSSQAWQDVVSRPALPDVHVPVANVTQTTPEPLKSSPSQPGESPTDSVASLLSQLQSSSNLSSTSTSDSHVPAQALVPVVTGPHLVSTLTPHYPTVSPSFLSPSSSDASRREDVRSFTFQQALPRLGQLSDNPAFIAAIAQLKKEQDDLERKLWAEREAIYEKYRDKVKVAKTKATMVGGGISRHEASMMTEAFERELRKFDIERVLPAWDSLITSQQAALVSHDVPTMFPTTSVNNRERQQRVIQVLEGIVGNGS